MSKKALEVSVILSAVDRMSASIDRATNAGIKKLEAFQAKADKIAERSFKIGRDAGMVGLAMAAPIAYATKQAIDFEKQMANVAKVANVDLGSQAFRDLGNDAKAAAVYLGRSGEQAAGLMASLLQGGVPLEKLNEITRVAGEMGVAFDMGADIAGERFVKMNNALGYTYDQTRLVTDAMNHLSNKVATTGEQLLEFMFAGGAGAANRLGIAGADMAAIGAVFNQIGISSAEAATIVERMEKGIRSNDVMRGIFDATGGGLQGFMKVLEVGSRMKGAEQFEFFKAFGEYGSKAAMLANNLGLVEKNLGLVANQSDYAGSAQREFQNFASTTAFKIAQQRERLNQLAVTFGDTLLPLIIKFLEQVTPMLESLNKWAQANPELAGTIMKVVAGAAALSFAISGVSFAFGGLFKFISVMGGPMLKAAQLFRGVKFAVFALRYHMLFSLLPALAAAKAAFISFSVAIYNIPVFGWILAAIAAIAAGAYLIYQNWEPIKAWFVGLWEHISAQFTLFVTFVQDIGTKMYEAGANIVKSIGDGIASQWDAFIARWEKRIQQLRDFLPFSPAKVGPLKDIHRIQLVETIAQAIRPAPLVSAMNDTMGAVAGYRPSTPQLAGIAGRGGGSVSINYNPVIQMGGGGGSTAEITEVLRKHGRELFRIFEQEMERKQRSSF